MSSTTSTYRRLGIPIVIAGVLLTSAFVVNDKNAKIATEIEQAEIATENLLTSTDEREQEHEQLLEQTKTQHTETEKLKEKLKSDKGFMDGETK